MRNAPLRAFAKNSPVKQMGDITPTVADAVGEVATTTGKQVTKKAIKEGVKKVAGRAAGALVGTAGAIVGGAGAAYGLLKGYGDLAKTEHGDQIIKDARMMPGKI